MSSFPARAVRALVTTAAITAITAPSTAAAVEPPIPEAGWEYSPEWDLVSDEYTAETEEHTVETFTEHFEDWTFTAWFDVQRAQNHMSTDLVQRKFLGAFSVAETGESLQPEHYLPGGWEEGIDYYTGGNFDERYWLHCPMDTAQGPECVEGVFPDGSTWAYVADATSIDAAVFFTDGSAARIWWGADRPGPEPAPLQVEPKQVVAAAADFSTESIWRALHDEHCPPGDICPHE